MSADSTPLPDKLEIKPITRPFSVTVQVPGSKSITNRALVLAALTAGPDGCELRGALRSEDTEVMIAALRDLGFEVTTRWDQSIVTVRRPEGAELIPASDADLFVGNSGTTMRFLTALVSLGHGRYRLDGVPRMRERPIEDLLIALRRLGVRGAETENKNGCPPVVIKASGLEGGRVKIKGDISSQFLSALLMVAPFARNDVFVEVDGPLVSLPYVAMTQKVMRSFKLTIQASEDRAAFQSFPHSGASPLCYDVEPDASAASYFFGAAAVCKSVVEAHGLNYSSVQGDVRFADVLEQMGCTVTWRPDAVVVRGTSLHGIDVDMNGMSDCVMTLATVACFAKGPTTIRNVAHIQHKETDRVKALVNELRRIGAVVEKFTYFDAGANPVLCLKIIPAPLHGAEIETYNDHRMAMSMALVGLRVPGIVIKNPGCVAKTYPEFFKDLEKLRS